MNDDIIKLVKLDFDNLENKCGLVTTELGVFVAEENKTAYGVMQEWINKLPPFKIYTGWNSEIYPQFKVVKMRVLNDCIPTNVT